MLISMKWRFANPLIKNHLKYPNHNGQKPRTRKIWNQVHSS